MRKRFIPAVEVSHLNSASLVLVDYFKRCETLVHAKMDVDHVHFRSQKGSASATRKGSLSPSRRCLRAGLAEAPIHRRGHVIETPPSLRGRRTSTAPGWQARGIDLQRAETESAAQKVPAIGGRRCPPTPPHSNSAEMRPRSFARGRRKDPASKHLRSLIQKFLPDRRLVQRFVTPISDAKLCTNVRTSQRLSSEETKISDTYAPNLDLVRYYTILC